jgi:CheY-like chemotaxis protein
MNNPQQALKAVQDGTRYALLITDMQMPEMDGNTLVAEIRKVRTSSELPAVLLSSAGLGSPNPYIQARLTKPVKPSQLYETIASVFHGGSPSEEPEADIRPERNSSLKILVAEDNRLNQKVALRMLEKTGCNADLACDGVEAVQMACSKDYDLIFMDVQMPRMDGLDATRELIRRFENKKRPVIIGMTAHAAGEERARGMEAGMDDYLTKPIQLVKLREVIRRFEQPGRES